MAILDKETGKPVDEIWRLVDKEADSEVVVQMYGQLLEALHEKGILTDQEVIDLIPNGFRWYTVGE